jgi:hypothetical protein
MRLLVGSTPPDVTAHRPTAHTRREAGVAAMTDESNPITWASEPVPTEPTARHATDARNLRTLHLRVCVPEPRCQWCLRLWPCPDAEWARLVLTRYTGVVPTL